jgi:hypothetical protein
MKAATRPGVALLAGWQRLPDETILWWLFKEVRANATSANWRP